MSTLRPRGRMALMLVCLPLTVLVFGSGISCPAADLAFLTGGSTVVVDDGPDVIIEDPDVIVIESDAFGIDLINDTLFDVDPGVSVDEFLLEDLGTLAPLEGSDVPLAFDVDCLPGDTLTIDPALYISPDVWHVAANGPVVLVEGVDYFCGDIITLQFSQDATGAFFVDVAVNDVFITF